METRSPAIKHGSRFAVGIAPREWIRAGESESNRVQCLEQNFGRKPETVTADAGYFSEAALTDEKAKGVDLLVPPDRQKHGTAPVQNSAADSLPVVSAKTLTETMRDRLRSLEGHALYKLRKQIVEPVFVQIKEARRIRTFLLRRLGKVQAEWQLICAINHLLKLGIYRPSWACSPPPKPKRTLFE